MRNHQARGWQIGIPSCLLTILQDIVFVFMSLVLDDIGISICTHRLYAYYGSLLLNIRHIFESEPAALSFLVSRITCWTFAISIIAARAHQVEISHTKPACIACVIKIGEAHAMRELMTESTDSIKIAITIQFATTSVSIHCYAIQ